MRCECCLRLDLVGFVMLLAGLIQKKRRRRIVVSASFWVCLLFLYFQNKMRRTPIVGTQLKMLRRTWRARSLHHLALCHYFLFEELRLCLVVVTTTTAAMKTKQQIFFSVVDGASECIYAGWQCDEL